MGSTANERDAASVWRYDGRRVVVTGCSSGIGEATARRARALGARVIGLDVKAPAAEVERFIPFDLLDTSSIDRAVETIAADAQIHALFNCAGISNGARGATPLDVFTVNFLGTRHLTERVVAILADGGAVASISSLGGLGWERNLPLIRELLAIDDVAAARAWAEAHPELFAKGGYGFSKQCLIVYSKLRCTVWAKRNVRTNTIGPSPVETPMLADSRLALGAAYVDSVPKPLGRISTADEQADVLLFLNSDAASFVTGQNLWTDGGYTAGVTTGTIPNTVR